MCPCLGLRLLVYLDDLFFIFSLIFILVNHIISLKQTQLFFPYSLENLLLCLNDNVDEKKVISQSKNSVSGCCSAFAWFFANFSLLLLIKVLLTKKKFVWFSIYVSFFRLHQNAFFRYNYFNRLLAVRVWEIIQLVKTF